MDRALLDQVRIVGAFEHPGRKLPHKSVVELHGKVALGALADARLAVADVDGLFTGRDAPGADGLSLADDLGIVSRYIDSTSRYIDSTESGGVSPLFHVGHAAAAIATGRCSVALVTLAGKARSSPQGGTPPPELPFELVFGTRPPGVSYALAARRHMHQFGATPEQLAAVKVAASLHAQHNPNAFLQRVFTVDDVLSSPMMADPVHWGDCCVLTNGGGAVILVHSSIARSLGRRAVKVLAQAESVRHANGGATYVTVTGAAVAGPMAFEEAVLTPADVDYASIYDSFTIAVIESSWRTSAFAQRAKVGRRRRRRARCAGRRTTRRHRRRWAVQQPSHESGRDHQDHRGSAPATGGSPACRPGPRLPRGLVSGLGGDLAARMRNAVVILGREDS